MESSETSGPPQTLHGHSPQPKMEEKAALRLAVVAQVKDPSEDRAFTGKPHAQQ